MGTCLSKKGSSSSSVPAPAAPAAQAPARTQPSAARTPDSPARKKAPVLQSKQGAAEAEEESFVKKEVFIIKHRKSHDRDISSVRVSAAPPADPKEKLGHKGDVSSKDSSEVTGNNAGVAAAAALAVSSGIRTSSCTKEEVESILIQCGRLSHSNSSSGKAVAASGCPASGGRSRRYSGSKRSYDFDHSNEDDGRVPVADSGTCDDDEAARERRQHRQLSRPSPRHGSRRRTPSRERDQQRSGSTERRRVSRSPGRRSEIASASAAGSSDNNQKPGKLVSVPATVPSQAEPPAHSVTSVRRISVKRNVGEGGRSAASPRSQSPARAREAPLTLSRNSSRKAEQSPHRRNHSMDNDLSRKLEQSPYRRNPAGDIDPSKKTEQSPHRRNPLSEIDHNSSSAAAPPSSKVLPHISGRVQTRNNKENEGPENLNITQVSVLKPNVDPNSRKVIQGTLSKVSNSKETEKLEVGSRTQEQQLQAAVPEAQNQKPQRLTRSRSSRRSSGHLEFDPEIQPNPTSYTNLLLEDIQNFHQTNPASISLPACVTKAHSIFQAVADLNASTTSDYSNALSEDKRPQPQTSYQLSSNCFKDPFVESEVGVGDDLMEPSMHRYVTVKRGGGGNTTPGGGDREELESSGSNSFMGSTATMQNQWEPGSADSSDCWTSSSASRAGLPSNYVPELDKTRRNVSGKRRDDALGQNGIGHGRVRCR